MPSHLFTTVQLVGQYDAPLVIVSFVPRAVGHVNVPFAATLLSQFCVANAVSNAVKFTLIDDNNVQLENMLT